MSKRQLLINALIAVALSALHRFIEESALLAMRFTAGKLSTRAEVLDPYLYRTTASPTFGRAPQPRGGTGNGQVVIRPKGQNGKYNPYPGYEPYEEMYG